MLSILLKKLFLCIIFVCFISSVSAKVLDVPEKIQEKNQWCWAGCSQAILEYYNVITSQTAIAEFGTEGQNIWNYLYGTGSSPTRRGINLILDNWGVANSYGYYILSKNDIQNQIDGNQPFVVRWGWDTGGGHFIVGRGIDVNNVYTMDPWTGNGYSIDDYDWIVKGGGHTWTHSLETIVPEPFLFIYCYLLFTFYYLRKKM